eukprot:3921346-Rhodomonas_salina.1
MPSPCLASGRSAGRCRNAPGSSHSMLRSCSTQTRCRRRAGILAGTRRWSPSHAAERGTGRSVARRRRSRGRGTHQRRRTATAGTSYLRPARILHRMGACSFAARLMGDVRPNSTPCIHDGTGLQSRRQRVKCSSRQPLCRCCPCPASTHTGQAGRIVAPADGSCGSFV